MTITLRSTKGSALTHAELDANFTDLNTGKAALAGSASQSFSMLNGTVAGTLSLTGASSTLGYGTGAGGTVTQATSKSTAVTLNKPCGQITMSNAALAAGASVNFQVVNSLVTSSSACVAHGVFIGTVNPDQYQVYAAYVQGGGFIVKVTNITAASLSEALVINFEVFSGATS